ncbi:hypothetical protein CLF_106368 [Clonorchis sinensis]|uniref:Coiled-coil domain-containing protein 89 n=1 Tax=Clonorchis sinensis TaxID=79923 RepID=G7YF20_CLOSI|nr:hypothetical protein CLF_106368 [Clonorchis sinensis]
MLIKDINIPLNTTEFNSNDINNVKFRLNEQSHLIMALKESADRELLHRKEFEEKLAQERDRSCELQEQAEELELRKAEIDKFNLTQRLMTILAERRNANLDFKNSKTLLEENYAQAKRQVEILQQEALENASRWSDERADFENQICERMIKEEELTRITQQLQQENCDLQKEIEELNLRRKKDAEALNANKQIKRLNNRLDEADARYKNLQAVFEAYKQHTNELLQAEKKLNKKLRQHCK